ncbi:tyrosine-type recombinase/integrase [Bacteroides sp.]|uniref:tyrosine-type recombinase/integrase n=1 Tax=Bacteroides sp. TaxID=29523 RepID=UPI0026251FB8|nr:tyrosine-type recombinase/integrase [Bacteroides sp.]MDD3041181.1 tyrosine-type recombinase/integrase [Bacteroides sp.]
MDEYNNYVAIILDYLVKNNYCSTTILANKRCFSKLEAYLSHKRINYSPEIADEWYASENSSISNTDKESTKVALVRLRDVYEAGRIKREHETKHFLSYSVLKVGLKNSLDEYLKSLEGKVAAATIDNHKHTCSRFMIYLQRKGISSICVLTYDLVIRFYKEDIHHGKWGKGQLNGPLSIMLEYFYDKGNVPYGFTVLIHYLTFDKECFWKLNDQIVHKTINSIMNSSHTVTVEEFHKYQLIFQKVCSENEYSKSVRSTFRKAIDLLLLFLDTNGYRYSPEIAMVWFDSTSEFFRKEAYSIRRSLCLIAQYYTFSEIHINSVFRQKARAFDLLPEWSRNAAGKYLDVKTSEGWAVSTLNMIRSSLYCFCIYLDSIGIRSFNELTALHIKDFNVQDIHKTPAGKNAYNARIRKFLFYLGDKEYLNNPMLFVALNRTSAPKETIVVVLSEAEMDQLNAELTSGETVLSLRKKAMLLLGLKMGMRSSDIVNLKFDNIDWQTASIRFIQSKTSVEVNLPMPTEVGNALFRYIMEERHKKAAPNIFLSEKAPHRIVGRAVCIRALKTALPNRDLEGSGFHVTRKTYATNLLRKGVGADMVANALGQQGTASVHRYLSLDVDRMRICALSLKDCGIGGWHDER